MSPAPHAATAEAQARADLVCRARRSLEEAASVPVVYSTAYYSLVVRGRMQRGETVLIHSGSGGVGQAAIAIALSLGCRVFTTVGKPTSPPGSPALPPPLPHGLAQQHAPLPTRVRREADVPPGQVPSARRHQLCQLPGHVLRTTRAVAHRREG